jgi:diaminohydroxyphosphoribosylaminopyrimidine deaminase / 5-amino-6-(5-phosphoribosylamino)uracil reductase
VRHVAAPGGQPHPIVLDTRLRTPVTAEVARPGAIVLCGPDAPPRARDGLADAGVEVAEVPLDAAGRLDLPAAMARLHALGITSVLAEPGATLAGALLDAGLVDRLVSHVALEQGDGEVRLPLPVEGWWVERLGGAGPDLVLQLRPGSAARVRSTPSEER